MIGLYGYIKKGNLEVLEGSNRFPKLQALPDIGISRI